MPAKIIEFYRPEKRLVPAVPPTAPEPSSEAASPTELLQEVLKQAGEFDTVLVMVKNKEGELAFSSNLPTLSECVLFMSQIHHKAVSSTFENGPEPKLHA